MIILDTNVLSEVSKPVERVALSARHWFERQSLKRLFLTSITVAEVLGGLRVMPEGRKRADITAAMIAVIGRFGDRILPFDVDAADKYADIYSARRRMGLSASTFDLQIAAIARATGMAVATRNVRHFVDSEVELIDPWSAA